MLDDIYNYFDKELRPSKIIYKKYMRNWWIFDYIIVSTLFSLCILWYYLYFAKKLPKTIFIYLLFISILFLAYKFIFLKKFNSKAIAICKNKFNVKSENLTSAILQIKSNLLKTYISNTYNLKENNIIKELSEVYYIEAENTKKNIIIYPVIFISLLLPIYSKITDYYFKDMTSLDNNKFVIKCFVFLICIVILCFIIQKIWSSLHELSSLTLNFKSTQYRHLAKILEKISFMDNLEKDYPNIIVCKK